VSDNKKTSAELFAEAESLRKQADTVAAAAMQLKRQELTATELASRLVYSAYTRCPCGAGLAYDPACEDPNSPFKGPFSGYWDCSEILLGTADRTKKHTDKLPFAFYEIKSEEQPSSQGATTRPKPAQEPPK